MRVYNFRSTYVCCIAVLMLVAGILAHPSQAQSRTMTLRAGLALSTLSGDADFEPLVNLGGAFAIRQRFGAFFLQTEAQVSTRGASLAVEEPYPPVPFTQERTYSRVRYDMTYADVPLLAGVAFGRQVRPVAYAGPYGGLRFNARNRYTYSDTGLTTTRETDDVALLDYGVIAGIGAEIPTRFYRVVIDVRATFGLASVFDGVDDQHHRMLMLTSGIVF